MVVSWQIMIFNVFWMIFMQLKFSPLKHLFLKILLIFTQNHENPKIWISTMFGPNKKNSKIEFLLKFFKNLEIYVLNSSGVLLYAPETHFWWFYEMKKIHRNPGFFIDFRKNPQFYLFSTISRNKKQNYNTTWNKQFQAKVFLLRAPFSPVVHFEKKSTGNR